MKLNLQENNANQRNIIFFPTCFSPINLSLNNLTDTNTRLTDLEDIVMTVYNDPVKFMNIYETFITIKNDWM